MSKERVDTTTVHEEAVIHTAFRTGTGSVSVEVRVVGVVEVAGRKYEFDRLLTVAAKPVKAAKGR